MADAPKDNASAEADSLKAPLHPKHWPVWLGIGLLVLLTRLPYSWQLGIGKGIGLLLHKVAGSRRRIAEVNMDICFPEKTPAERAALVRQIFIDNGIGLMETFMGWFRDPQWLRPKTEFVGFDKVREAQANGQGVMLLGAHYSMLDLAGSLLSTELRISVSYRPQDNPVMNYIMERNRARFYDECLTRKDIRGFIRTLRQGNVLWYAQDQDFGRKNSVFVNFFGYPAATITATSRIAKAGKALVMPITYFRKPDNSGYIITVFDPINIPSGDDEADAQLANDFIEARLRENPSQYLWLHKRFKTTVDPKEKKGSIYNKKK
ncbi:MAG: LpxL/LpxP family Kdo(2)-lipid IV(A) lauroyl/palmitoleoyl acyltransferase [Thalassolituus sp.]